MMLAQDIRRIFMLIEGGAVFGLVLAVWLAAVTIWSLKREKRDRTVGQRLGLREPGGETERVLRLWHEGSMASTTVRDRAVARSWVSRLRVVHEQAGLGDELQPAVLGLAGSMAICALGAWALTGSLLVAAGIAAVVVLIYSGYLQHRVRKRSSLFEKQFVAALELAARSLRAGHPLLGAFHLIAEELDPPVSTAFAQVCQQHAMGVSLEEAIQRIADTSPSEDLKLFSTSVAIQLRSGGNLADMMDRLAFVIRERLRLGRRIRVLTAQTQFSKRILIGLPFVLFAALNLANHEYAATLYTTREGTFLLGVAGAAMVLGIVAMNRLAVLKY
jgi:tight adherence protein B